MWDKIIEATSNAITSAAAEQIDNNSIISWDQLKSSAKHFIESYSNLLILQEAKKLTELRNIVSSGNFLFGNNDDVFFIRSKYLLAFQFDYQLTLFREELPKSVLFVYETSSKESIAAVETVNISMQQLVQLISSDERVYQNLTILQRNNNLKNEEKKEIEEEKVKKIHLQKAQSAYAGTIARLNKFYETSDLKQKQSGLLMWKIGREWQLAKITNLGDVKEAYASALMRRHKSNIDYLCAVKNIGSPDYYSHELISTFFNNYIYNVTNKPAIIEEDIYINRKEQFSVKSNKAGAPSFNQYYDFAKFICQAKKPLSKEKINYELQNRNKDTHRNIVLKNLTNINKEVIEELKKEFDKK